MHKNIPALLTVIFALFLSACGQMRSALLSPASNIDAGRYYAVFLSNGAVYFGHLESFGTSYPVLRDVYYVESAPNPDTKSVSSVLVKRGKEWHGPDRMIINAASILFVEPVGPDSKVAELIAQSKR